MNLQPTTQDSPDLGVRVSIFTSLATSLAAVHSSNEEGQYHLRKKEKLMVMNKTVYRGKRFKDTRKYLTNIQVSWRHV